MSTDSLESVLYRDLSKVLAKDMTRIAVPLLRDVVNDGTYVFTRCLDSSKKRKGPHEPALFSYLHMIEMTDAVEVLVAEACSAPTVLFLRSSFEALLTVKYLLESDYERRSLAFLVRSAHRRKGIYSLFDPETTVGKDFLHDWDIDLRKHWPGPGIVSFKEEAREAAARIQELLGEERYAEVEREYQRLRKKHGSRIEWYQFFDGPRNLRELARRFNCRDRYDFLYRSWAAVSHAMDISRFLTKTPDGPSMVKRLRDPGSIATFAGIAVTLLLEARRLMLGKFRPGEEASTKRWYIANIQGRFLTLARLGKPTE